MKKKYSLFLLCFSFLFTNSYNHQYYIPSYKIPPPQYPSDNDPLIFSLSGAYTFWVPYQENMILLTTNIRKPIPNNDYPTPSEAALFLTKNWIDLPQDPRSGFKAGFGINTLHDGWTLNTEYTWFDNNPPLKNIYLETENWFYLSSWLYPMETNLATFEYYFRNQFNRIDTKLQRNFYAGNFLSFAPWIGLIGAWEKQYLFTQGSTLGDSTKSIEKSSSTQKKKFWCIGTYGGFNAAYYFSNNWAIELNSGASLNISKNTTNAVFNPIITNFDVSSGYDPQLYITSTKYFSVDPMIESNIGLLWDCIGINWQLQMQVKWDLQIWFNHNTFVRCSNLLPNSIPTIYTKESTGNYSMQGLTAKIAIFF